MGTIEADEVLTRDKSSGRVHRRFQIPGSSALITFEGDNLDAAGDYEIIDNLDGVELEDKCKRCFEGEGRE